MKQTKFDAHSGRSQIQPPTKITTQSIHFSPKAPTFGAPEATLFRTQSVTYIYMLPHSVRNNGDPGTPKVGAVRRNLSTLSSC